ncbi:hypothetical protein BCON_0093g00340 [Botryotinia convoluta]|uniref:Uncharacterized protein n=1 Tax=Botryotinia convoluta TaxID=54673 RepID=A0A4Z1I1K9_9HELO|nr:hypothetical protein BCON_0093g00340 [Botryotinia convoluta]
MESSSRNARDIVFSHGQEMKYMDENTLKQSSQDTTSTSTPNTNPTSSSSPPKLLKSSTSKSITSQAPIYPSNPFSNFPFSSNRSGTAPKISITTTIDSMISDHQNRNVGLSLMTRDLVASPVQDFILGSPLEGFM